MKKTILIATLFVFAASIAFGAPFSPETMTISAQDVIQYDFDGTDVDIDFEIDGAPGKVFLFITTSGMGEDIGELRNGNRGWHYVNKIDTAVYYTTGEDFSVGTGTITWDGTDMDDGQVAAGEYVYYLYAYDNQSPKIRAIQSNFIYNNWSQLKYVDHEFQPIDPSTGENLAQPIVWIDQWSSASDGELEKARWFLGADAFDAATGQETSTFSPHWQGHLFQYDPYEMDYLLTMGADSDVIQHIQRWEWVPGGAAVLDTNWGDDGEVTYTASSANGGWDAGLQIFKYPGDDMIIAGNSGHYGFSTEAELLIIDAIDGFEVDRMDVSSWWVNIEDGENGGQASGGPDHGQTHREYGNGKIIMGAHGACLVHMINPTLGETEEEFNLWINANGDIIGDRNYQTDATNPWVCFDYTATPNTYNQDYDQNGFVVVASTGLGTPHFALYGPDGTGIGNYSFFGDGDGVKHMNEYIDVDGPFDGLYVDNTQLYQQPETVYEDGQGIWYVAHDSMNGIITSETTAVEDAAPAAFSVAQNTPNPFNPTTTINFQLVNAANTTVEVFNVAGQKVDTLVNGYMDAGQHSVTWNASDFSAGVYFYTVKSGDFSQTMKMTLLK